MRCSKAECKAYALKIDEFCYVHSEKPEIVERRQAARRRGGSKGKLSKAAVNLETVADIQLVLAEVINELRTSPTDNIISKGRAIAHVCGVMLTAIGDTELEERVAKLEEERVS